MRLVKSAEAVFCSWPPRIGSKFIWGAYDYFWLLLSVFGPLKMITGAEAVMLFFVISGFYMALILNKKNQKATLFYSNR